MSVKIVLKPSGSLSAGKTKIVIKNKSVIDPPLTKVIDYEEVVSPVTTTPSPVIKPVQSLKPKINVVKQPMIIIPPDEIMTKLKSKPDPPKIQSISEPSILAGSTILKIKVKKTATSINYKSQILDQKPVKVIPSTPIYLPPQLKLETFYEDNVEYWIDWASGYIFHPDIAEEPYEPLGRIIETPADPEMIREGFIPMMTRDIEWYYRYELDVDSK